MEIVIILLLFVISVEEALILYNLSNKKEEKAEANPRREITGTFKDPLGDKYRHNAVGLYKPVRPRRGDEDDV